MFQIDLICPQRGTADDQCKNINGYGESRFEIDDLLSDIYRKTAFSLFFSENWPYFAYKSKKSKIWLINLFKKYFEHFSQRLAQKNHLGPSYFHFSDFSDITLENLANYRNMLFFATFKMTYLVNSANSFNSVKSSRIVVISSSKSIQHQNLTLDPPPYKGLKLPKICQKLS